MIFNTFISSAGTNLVNAAFLVSLIVSPLYFLNAHDLGNWTLLLLFYRMSLALFDSFATPFNLEILRKTSESIYHKIFILFIITIISFICLFGFYIYNQSIDSHYSPYSYFTLFGTLIFSSSSLNTSQKLQNQAKWSLVFAIETLPLIFFWACILFTQNHSFELFLIALTTSQGFKFLIALPLELKEFPYHKQYRMKDVWKENQNLIQWMSFDKFLSFLASQGDRIFIAPYMGFVSMGLYSTLSDITQFIQSRTAQILQKVYAPQIYKQNLYSEQKKIFYNYLKTVILCGTILICLEGLILKIAPYYFVQFQKKDWLFLGLCLAGIAFFRLISNPSGQWLMSHQLFKNSFLWNLIWSPSFIFCNWILMQTNPSLENVAFANFILLGIGTAIWLFYVQKTVKKHFLSLT